MRRIAETNVVVSDIGIGVSKALKRNWKHAKHQKRLKGVYWWCYMHQPEPLSASEMLKVMATDKSYIT